jgi:hypothetical protein
LIFDDIATLKYNKLVREGRQTSFAPMLNFVVTYLTLCLSFHYGTFLHFSSRGHLFASQRTEIQKQAVEHETALESFPHGEKGESSFREFVKVHP